MRIVSVKSEVSFSNVALLDFANNPQRIVGGRLSIPFEVTPAEAVTCFVK